MNKEFIPYEEAFALKELGFDEECLGVYRDKGEELWIDNFNPIEFLLKQDETAIKAPLYQQAFRFFREKYDLDYSLLPESSSGHRLSTRTFNIVIYKYHMNMNVQSEIVRIDGKIVRYNKREEAELACLKKLIEIANDKQ